MNKKHIGGWVLFFAGSVCLCAGTITAETSAKDNQGNYYGFTLALGTGDPALTDPDGILASLSGSTVTLDDVSILTRSNNSYANAKLAVYSYQSDGNVGNFVGLSDAVSFVPSTDTKFTFDNLDLTVGERYQFLFVNASATSAALTNTENSTLLQLYQMYALAWGISVTADMYSGSLLPKGWGLYTSSGLNSWEGHRMPVAAVTVSSAAIPEYSSFGLLVGVGALLFASAGRRRKRLVPEQSGQI